MAETTVKTYHCKNCATDLKDGVITCPKCGLTRLRNLSQFLELGDDDTKQLLESFDRERKNRDEKKIGNLLKKADSWRTTKEYTEEYVKGIRNVLHFTKDGDIEVKRVTDIGTVDRKRAADTGKVVEYLKEAAGCGSLKALVLVGKSYLAGYGCKRNTISAIAVLCRAAIAGSKEAYRILVQGDEFYKGETYVDMTLDRIPSDIYHEVSWNYNSSYYTNNLTNLRFWVKRDAPVAELERFSASNMLWATYILGEFYLLGIFVKKDVSKGIELICKAADDGPYHVQRAIKAKALLLFDKLLKVDENNVDAAVSTIWRIENLYIRREAQVRVLARTSLIAEENGKMENLFSSRGSQLIWRAIKHFKEVTNAQWITLPDSKEQCKKLSQKLFGRDDDYPGVNDTAKTKDGKEHYYRAPFLGRDGFFGANGIVFSSWRGLLGNLHSKENPNYGRLEYNAIYNYSMGDIIYPRWSDVDLFWLFRQPECMKRRADSQYYVDWGMDGNPVDFKPAGLTEADLFLLIDYVRRYLFSDLRKGVILADGSIQKTQYASNIDVSMEPSAHTKAFLELIGQKISVNIQGDKPKEGVSSVKTSSSTAAVDANATSVKKPEEAKASEKPEPTPSKETASKASTKTTKQKKRWLFILLGVLFAGPGLQFVYAKRWGWWIAHLILVGCGIAIPPVLGAVALLWIGSLLFMKKDGKGNLMS